MRLTKDFCLLRSLFLIIFLSACASVPAEKENLYRGEPLSKIGINGLLIGHVEVPLDSFPFDRKTTIIYLENIQTKQSFQYGDTQGPFFMKLPPGDYVIKELWVGGGCHMETGLMISTFLSQLPERIYNLRNVLEKPASIALGFKIHKGKSTDIGNILVTCMEWDSREKFKQQFTSFADGGNFQIYRPMNNEQHDCGCKILRKRDGKSMKSMKEALKDL